MSSVIDVRKLSESEVSEFETYEPYHLRCAYNPVSQTIQILMSDAGIDTYGVTMTGLTPMLGHPTTEGCCIDVSS